MCYLKQCRDVEPTIPVLQRIPSSCHKLKWNLLKIADNRAVAGHTGLNKRELSSVLATLEAQKINLTFNALAAGQGGAHL